MMNKTLIMAFLFVSLAAGTGVFLAKTDFTAGIFKPVQAKFVVSMTPGAFEPPAVNVFRNTNVCFKNKDKKARWPASNIHPTHAIFPEFDPGAPVPSGKTWCFIFKRTGIWRFHDHLFPELNGVVNVRGK